MKKTLLGLLVLGLTSQGFSQIVQTEKLSEVVVTAVNYKYLDATTNEEVALPVKKLAQAAASYNIKESELYSDEYEFYTISFFIPEGQIVAIYNPDGQIIRTVEKFKNIKMPNAVAKAVKDTYPKWDVESDVYLVSYTNDKGAKKTYKLKLKNGDKRMRVKVDETGTFL
ncbi:nicotinate-nucleotide adenylyltransferase [Flavobacteriaceae bacterium KMM 6897]|nr:nicotinate-nucleotide adenylyltransferase [Flavobacteriaceae bacterium KMM 6897]